MGGNDLLAIGVMRQARARGLRVPDDLAVTGFNDFAFAEFVEPPLTTVHVPGYEIGRTAAQLLIEHLDGAPAAATADDPSGRAARARLGMTATSPTEEVEAHAT